jgi:hypothetical protein
MALFRRQKTSGCGFTECFRGATIGLQLEVAWHRRVSGTAPSRGVWMPRGEEMKRAVGKRELLGLRGLLGLVLALLLTVAYVGSASAANADRTRYSFHGTFASAAWFTNSSTGFVSTYVNVSQTQPTASELYVYQSVGNFDSSGNYTGATVTIADVTSGFSFAIDGARLSSASVDGSGLPATTCSYDANYNLIGCTDTTIDVNATWTGVGAISRGTSNSNQHYQYDGVKVTLSYHFNGTNRNATASGSVAGVTLTTDDLSFAGLGSTNYGQTDICVGSGC